MILHATFEGYAKKNPGSVVSEAAPKSIIQSGTNEFQGSFASNFKRCVVNKPLRTVFYY